MRAGRVVGAALLAAAPLLAGAGPASADVFLQAQAKATATATANSGATTGGQTSLLAGTPGGVTVGASSASSDMTSRGGTLHLRVQSSVHDISIAGLVTIASVVARDDIVITAGKR